MRFEIGPPPGHSFTDWIGMGISPDGRYLVFQANDASGKASLWQRPLDSFEARELVAAEASFIPFTWAPDSRTLFYTADGKLVRVDVAGGPPETICSLRVLAAPIANRQGVFLAMTPESGPLVRFTADNCTPAEATTLDRSRHFGHMWPYFLPDGRHFLYAALATNKNHEIWEGSLDSKDARLVLRNASVPAYVESGYLLFERHGVVMAQAFDWKSLQLSGEPVQLVKEQLLFSDLGGLANYDVSQTGVLVYQVQPEQRGRFLWYDRSGKPLGAATAEPGLFLNGRLSPDGRRMVATTYDPQTHLGDLWSYDFSQNKWTRLTFDSTPGGKIAVWSPDGKRMIYHSIPSSGSVHDLYTMSAEGGAEELLLHSDYGKTPQDWSADGRFLLFDEDHANAGSDVWILDLASRKASPLLATKASERDAHFSPDGRWIVFVSDQSGRPEVYLQTLNGSTRLQVSSEGGGEPRWRPDGRGIYYVSPGQRFMAVELTLGPSPKVSQPKMLFDPPPGSNEYEVARDGRLLVRVPASSAGRDRFQVVANWMAEVTK